MSDYINDLLGLNKNKKKEDKKDTTGIDTNRPWDSPVLKKTKPATKNPTTETSNSNEVAPEAQRALDKSTDNSQEPFTLADRLDKRNKKIKQYYGE